MLINRTKLGQLLQQASKVVNTRNTIPVLATVKLVADGNSLTVTATDLDIEITAKMDCSGSLSACIDARLLSGIIGKLSANDVEIEVDGNTAVIKAGRSRFKLPVLPVEDFPTMDVGQFDAEFEADPSSIFGPVAFAMSIEAARYYLCGVYLQPTAVTATDGHRLSTVSIDLGAEFEPVIVPSATVAVAPKGKTTVRVSSGKIQFSTGETTITSRLVDGSYPDYERVIPRGQENTAVFDNAELKAAAERVSVVSIDKTPSIKLALDGEEIAVTARAIEAEAADMVKCAYDGPAQAVGFNANYLKDVLSALPAGEVRMAVGDCNGPVVFVSDAAPEQRIVLMPVRVG